MGTGGGFAVWPDERRIKGSVDAKKTESNAINLLEAARRHILSSDLVESAKVGEISEVNGI
jgi:hypothetical protein